jgi:hypothetical protein
MIVLDECVDIAACLTGFTGPTPTISITEEEVT